MPIESHGRRAILVLGMHRSGTSALAGTLVLAGASEPATLMPPGQDNPKGYWESVSLMGFHDEVLASCGSSWDDWGRIGHEWFDSSPAKDFSARIPGLLRSEFGDAPLFVVKDPRVCRLLPLWRTALERLDIEASVVMPLRHPGEVAGSLSTRDGFSESRGLLLWLRHTLEAEFESRSMSRTFVRYEDLLDDWRSVMSDISSRTGTQWPRDLELEAGRIEAFLERSLRHHTESAAFEDVELEGWLTDTVRALDQLAAGSADDDIFGTLDRVRQDFDRTWSIYDDAVGSQVAQHRREALELQREAIQAREVAQASDGRNADLEAQMRQMQESAAEIAQASERQRADLEAQVRQMQQELRDDQDVIEEAARRRAELAAEADGLRSELEGATASAALHWSRVVDLEQRYVASRSQVDRQARELASLARRALAAEERADVAAARARAKVEKASRVAMKAKAKRREMATGLAKVRSDTRALDAELSAIRQSRSWRATAPIRSATSWVRRLVRGREVEVGHG